MEKGEPPFIGHIIQRFWEKIKASREVLDPMEASYCHLLITPPSHCKLQKVRGLVGRFFVNEG
jgi:hypothetical protein